MGQLDGKSSPVRSLSKFPQQHTHFTHPRVGGGSCSTLLSHCFPSKASAELNQQSGSKRCMENPSQNGPEGTAQRRDTGLVCLKPGVSTHQPERKGEGSGRLRASAQERLGEGRRVSRPWSTHLPWLHELKADIGCSPCPVW